MTNNTPAVAPAHEKLQSAQKSTPKDAQMKDIDKSLEAMFVGATSSGSSPKNFKDELQVAREERFSRLS